VPFIVLTPAPKPTVKKGETPPVAANQPWYGALWQSVQDAGRAAPAASPAAK
jgi:hypothetical protein